MQLRGEREERVVYKLQRDAELRFRSRDRRGAFVKAAAAGPHYRGERDPGQREGGKQVFDFPPSKAIVRSFSLNPRRVAAAAKSLRNADGKEGNTGGIRKAAERERKREVVVYRSF